MSNLVDHAQLELEQLGEDPATIEAYLKVVRAFARMRHSGGSAVVAIMVLNRLFHFVNLTPLTNDPYEWEYYAPEMWDGKKGIWQNKRDSEAFSHDGGQTYWHMSEKIGKKRFRRLKKHTSVMTIPFKYGVKPGGE